MSEPTHIVIFWKSNEAEHMYRASDGMLIGERKNHVVLSGENPNKRESRIFLDFASATKYLRDVVAMRDLADQAEPRIVQIEDRDAERLVIVPSGAIELPGSGTRKLN